MQELTEGELLALFKPEHHDRLRELLAATDLVIFENVMMDSSAYGSMTAVQVGPGHTFPSIVWCEGKHMTPPGEPDVPSRWQYPRYFCLSTTRTDSLTRPP